MFFVLIKYTAKYISLATFQVYRRTDTRVIWNLYDNFASDDDDDDDDDIGGNYGHDDDDHHSLAAADDDKDDEIK